METITFTCKIITPMFLAGADGSTPELRAASIKGALRFWWRACNGHLGLEEMRKREQEIFGGVGPNPTNRSKVIVRVRGEGNLKKSNNIMPQGNAFTVSTPGTNKKSNILEYLAYGAVTYPKTIDRGHFEPGGKFEIVLTTTAANVELMKDLITLLSFFGGIGSRSRNGYGCFSVSEVSDNPIGIFTKYKKGPLCSHTTFSKESVLFQSKNTHTTWPEALAEVGSEYRLARLGLEKRHEGTKRKMISQPLFIKDSLTGKNSLSIPSIPKPVNRNAKSFFIGLTESNGEFKGHILYLPHNLEGNPTYKSINDLLAKELSTSLTLHP